MDFRLLTLLAETSLHPGAGRDTGVVDLPVAREAVTDFPVIVGPSLKGAMRERAREQWPDVEVEKGKGKETSKEVKAFFGKRDDGGALLVHDARLLLLPVRSLDTPFRWVTCPQILERLRRDLDRSGIALEKPLPEGTAIVSDEHFLGAGSDTLILEERLFKPVNGGAATAKAWSESLASLFPDSQVHEAACGSLAEKLTILSDGDFAWFARHGLPVNARNVLDVKTKTSKNLWYEETLPPDTFFYSVIGSHKSEVKLADFAALFPREKPYLQIGGNATVGMGWCACRLIGETKAGESEGQP